MHTLKSAALVVVLAGVLYGVYVVLNQPPVTPPPGMTQEQVDNLGPPQLDFGTGDDHETTSGDRFAPPSTTIPPAPGELTSPAPDFQGAGNKFAADPGATYGSGGAPPPFPADGSANAEPGASAADVRRSSYDSAATPGSKPNVDDTTKDTPNAFAAATNPANRGGSLTSVNFRRDWQKATQEIEEKQFRDALATLTPYYGSPDLTPEQSAELLEWLDALAAKVIYSPEHLLAGPHVVRSNRERLVDVALKYGVSAQLLLNINSDKVDDPSILVPTTELKVVPGPFRAEVNLSSGEVTVFLQDLYAGRFPFVLGDEPPVPGEYEVRQLLSGHVYVGSTGSTVPTNDPTNPYGNCWISLGSQACLHGSPAVNVPGPTRGCVSLSPQDAKDLMGILTAGSKVVIRN